jgi:hypothetical protein
VKCLRLLYKRKGRATKEFVFRKREGKRKRKREREVMEIILGTGSKKKHL